MTTFLPGFDQLFIVLFIGGALIAVAMAEIVFGPNRQQRKNTLARMRALAGPNAQLLTEGLVRRKPEGSAERRLPLVGDLPLALHRAGFQISARSFLVGSALATLTTGIIASAFISPLIGVPLGLAIGYVIPVSVLKSRHQTRVQIFVTQLPDALDLMMRGLKVGHPISVTIGNVARTMPEPIGPEFGRVAKQISHGDYLTDAFADLAQRIGQEDMDYLSVSLGIQHGTGGNLAEMLGTLSKVIRDRIMMRRRVHAISSEGRISALILSALPVLIYGATTITAPDYYGGVSDDPMFMPVACVIIALVVANGLALRKLVNFQV